MKTLQSSICLSVIMVFVSFAAQAGQVTSTFSSGDTLSATHMNEIKDAVNDNDSRVTTNESSINTNAADITTNAAGITTNAAGITTNAAGIATNASDITANDSRIGAIETQTQNLATGCPAGQSIRAVGTNGVLTCATNDVTAAPSTVVLGDTAAMTSATYVTIGSQSINIPAPGYVVAMASSTLYCPDCNTTNNSISYRFTLCHTVATCGVDGESQRGRIYYNSSAADALGYESNNITVHRSFFFATAGVKTIYYRARRYSGTASLNVTDNAFTLMYVPQ